MFSSLRVRLLLSFISLAIFPVLVVSAIVSQRSVSVLNDEAVNTQHEIALRVSIQIDNFLTNRELDLQRLDDVWGFSAKTEDEQEALLRSLLLSEKSYQEITLLDNSGQEKIKVSRIGTVGVLSDRSESNEFIIPITTGTSFYSPVRFDDAIREPVITFSMPLINERTGAIASVLVVDIRFKEVWDLIAGLEFDSEETVFVTDSVGQIVAHSNPSVVLSNTVFDLPSEDGRTTGLSNTDVVLAMNNIPIGDQELIIVVERPSAEALILSQNILYAAAIVTAITLLIAVVLVFLLVHQIVRPIEKLTSVARAIREGDLSLQSDIKRNDEIGELSQTFDSMTHQLNESINNLEERVATRTRDLSIAANVSRQITTVLDLNNLLPELTNLTRTSFDLYYVGVFIVNHEENVLHLRAGSGDLASQAIDTNFTIDLNSEIGLIGKAVAERKVIVVNDVSLSDTYRAHPLLNQTKSEIVLPMFIGDTVIGVLDIQSAEVNNFTPDDVRILTSLAEQIAIAVRNAELFSDAKNARQSAEKANQVKSQFLAAMSHELRTPLNGILNFTHFVSTGMFGPVNEKQVDILNKSAANGEHLLALINDVLDISKIESGSLDLFVETDVDIKHELDPVISTGKAMLVDKSVELKVLFDEDVPLIMGDKRRIRQVMTNLVSNACKFTQQGKITIHVRLQDEHIIIEVKDTGSGIAPEDQTAIFEAFQQTATGLRQSEGTGLGLPISKRLTEAHGGRLWVESIPKVGSAFFILLPVKSNILTPTIG